VLLYQAKLTDHIPIYLDVLRRLFNEDVVFPGVPAIEVAFSIVITIGIVTDVLIKEKDVAWPPAIWHSPYNVLPA
jgi:hypothetical protein